MTGEYLLNVKGVADKVAVSEAQIYAMVREGTFPLPIPVGRLSRWRGSDVDAWIVEQASKPRPAIVRGERGKFAKAS